MPQKKSKIKYKYTHPDEFVAMKIMKKKSTGATMAKNKKQKKARRRTDKENKIEYIPVENLPSTWEGFCIMILTEVRMIRRTLKQIKGILSEIKEGKRKVNK